MFNSEPASSGLLTSVRRLLDTGLATIQNRAELAAVEFKEEKDQALELMLWAIMVFFFAMMTGMVLTATVILAFPQERRVYVAAVFAVLYLAGGLWTFLGLRARLKKQSVPFSATVDEIKRDREWLTK